MKSQKKDQLTLKWHRALEFVILPVMLAVSVYLLFSQFAEIFSLKINGIFTFYTPLLKYLGFTMHNLGIWFWPLVGWFLFSILMLVLLFKVWTGMMKWKKGTRHLWNLYLFLLLASAGLFGYGAYFAATDDISAFNYMLDSMLKADIVLNRAAVLIIAIVLVIVLILFLAANMIYYRHRRHLFGTGIVHVNKETVYESTKPEEKPAETASTEEAAPAANPVSEAVAAASAETEPAEPEAEESLTQPIPVIDDQMEASAEEASAPAEAEAAETSEEDTSALAEEEAVKTPAEEKPEAFEVPEPDAAYSKETESEKNKYCPNCGAELTEADQNFCTHCGAKLNSSE